jgi:hypothetical protein
VNFVGHAHVALRIRDDAPFVLGAMLPDFCSMARVRVAHTSHDGLAAGIAFHHQVDDAFHGAPTFLSMCGEASDRLERDGLARGPARAAAHVGIELCLDGLLVRDEATRAAYRAAVASAAPARLGQHLAFRAPEHAERYATFVDRLVAWGVPDDYADPEIVVTRLVQTLMRRPRLALGEADLPKVRAFMDVLRTLLEDRKDVLFEELHTALDHPA